MNTCAECRFWKDMEIGARFFLSNPAADSRFKECTRAGADEELMYVASRGADDTALMTRSDFGCVQFEAKQAMRSADTIVMEWGGRLVIGEVLPLAYLDEVKRRLAAQGRLIEDGSGTVGTLIDAALCEEVYPRAEYYSQPEIG